MLEKTELALQEILKGEIFRPKSYGYSETADETLCMNDLITNVGRVYIAARMSSVADATANSLMSHMAVGTVSTAAALADTSLTGEIKRKAMSSFAASSNIVSCVATFGGFADSVTSLSIVEAGILNHATSGSGILMQRVTFAAVILANSDIFKLTLETNVGSNTI